MRNSLHLAMAAFFCMLVIFALPLQAEAVADTALPQQPPKSEEQQKMEQKAEQAAAGPASAAMPATAMENAPVDEKTREEQEAEARARSLEPPKNPELAIYQPLRQQNAGKMEDVRRFILTTNPSVILAASRGKSPSMMC